VGVKLARHVLSLAAGSTGHGWPNMPPCRFGPDCQPPPRGNVDGHRLRL